MRLALLFVLLTANTYAQAPSPSATQEVEGRCNSVVVGSDNRITIDCDGVSKVQGDQLLKVLNTILKRQLDPATVLAKLDDIQSGVSDIKGQLAVQSAKEQEQDRIRRTAPEIDPYLVAIEKNKVNLCTVSKNLIPFQYHYFIVKSNNDIVGGFPMGDAPFYPTNAQNAFCLEKEIDLSQIADHYLELRFWFKSMSYDELHLPGHGGEIVKKYTITTDLKLNEISSPGP